MDFVATTPGLFLDEIANHVWQTQGISISARLISKILARSDITRKRGTRVHIRYNVERGLQFLHEVRSCYSILTASLDEMAVMLNMAPTHGWAPRGKRAVIRQPSKRTVSYMLVLCICPIGVLYWSLRSGSIDSVVFSEVMAKLPNGMTLLLDNARVHHASKCLVEKGLPTIAELAASKSITLKFTPPYAPHLNPVEFTFNTVRQLLRRAKPWTETELGQALTALFKTDSFSKDALTKLFKSVVWGGARPGERLESA